MNKKSRKLVAGVVVICILGGAYYGLRVYNEKTEEAEEEAAEGETILEVDASDVTAISFTAGGEQVTFTLQDDDTWQKEDDDTFPVDSSALLGTLDELAELKSVRTLTDIEDISEYGLEEPQNTITLMDSDGTETIITIGDNNESTGNDYLMLNEDSATVYTVDTALSSSFSDDLYDYAVSEEIPTLQASTITGIHVETADGDGYNLYLQDALWMVSGESDEDVEGAEEELRNGAEADADLADTLTSALGGLAYVDYLDHNCTDFSEYGLDEPAVTLTVTYEEEAESEAETEALSDDEAGTEADAVQDDEAETEAETVQDDEAGTEAETVSDTENVTETEAATGDETETESETEVEMVERTVTFLIGDTDDNGDYYVQMDGSAEVHTLSGSVVETLLGYSANDLVADAEEETEEASETETE